MTTFTNRPPGMVRSTLLKALLMVGAVGLLLAVGRLSVTQPSIALIIVLAVVSVAVTAVHQSLVPLASLPFLLIVVRVGGSGVDLSVSDFVLTLAAVPATLMAQRPFAKELRAVLWALSAYQFATLLTVVNNPYMANVVEWFHAGTMVAGGLLVGWAVGIHGHARLGLRLLIGGIAVIALITVVHGVVQYGGGDFGAVYPTWPYEMHKNFVGTVCGLGACLVYVRPVWVGLSKRVSWSFLGLFVTAVLMSQSRQAVVGLVVAIAVLVFRSDTDRKRSKLVVLLMVPIIAFVTNLVQDQVASGNRFNSLFQRITWFQDSLEIWSTDPWLGVGLRWWYTDRFAARFQPPNAEVEVLTTAGIVGLVAFVWLLIVCVRSSLQLDPVYGSVALAVLVNRLAQAQFDLFWAAVQGSIPFVILALCIGAQRHAEQQRVEAELTNVAAHRDDALTRVEALKHLQSARRRV